MLMRRHVPNQLPHHQRYVFTLVVLGDRLLGNSKSRYSEYVLIVAFVANLHTSRLNVKRKGAQNQGRPAAGVWSKLGLLAIETNR